MAKPRNQVDPVIVTERASALSARGATQYWVVFDLDDLLALWRGEVSRPVKLQCACLLHREPNESADEYIARLKDMR